MSTRPNANSLSTVLLLATSLGCGGSAATTVQVSALDSDPETDPKAELASGPQHDHDHQEKDEHEAPKRLPPPSPEEIAALPPDGGEEFNRLVFEESPYLLQHARNPVDWYPWGEEAFERARAEEKPIFLSIGYSTCHWCHVMEHESFEDEEVAAVLNASFVCVKVDREERPDVDHVYMSVTQAFTGRGGWPNTIVMTAEKKPFFAATYIPKRGRANRPGMMELMPRIADLWANERDALLADAERAATTIGAEQTGSPGDIPGRTALDLAYRQLSAQYESGYGGFGTAPKFPIPHKLLFLLHVHRRTGDARALEMVEHTLTSMRRGGIWDHVGFGFHRYSTDTRWFLPHFEKMLYDQALIAMALVAAWQVSGDEAHRQTAEEIFTYVLRDMTSPEGGFYSAEDADSEGEEGLFYLWTPDEVRAVVSAEDAELFIGVYDIREEGNFVDEATREKNGRSIPNLARSLADHAQAKGLTVEELSDRLEAIRVQLFTHREGRIHPLKDDKVLTDWNGLMIAALARASTAFDEKRYEEAATRAAEFCWNELRNPEDGRLYKRWRLGKAGLKGALEDYAFLAWGYLELYEASFETRWLTAAIEIVETMLANFHDPERGGFYIGPEDGEELFVRAKEFYDGALPSGNSVAALVLAKLGRLTTRAKYEELARKTLAAHGASLGRHPTAYSQMLLAADFLLGPSYELVLAGDPQASDFQDMLRAVRRPFVPNKVVLHRPPGEAAEVIALAPYAEHQTTRDGQATAYVCQDYTCQAPTSDPNVVLASLEPNAPAETPAASGEEDAGGD